MSYQTKFVRRAVRKRQRVLTQPVQWGWRLILECGHELTTSSKAGAVVQRPVCPECNQIAVDLGRAKELVPQ